MPAKPCAARSIGPRWIVRLNESLNALWSIVIVTEPSALARSTKLMLPLRLSRNPFWTDTVDVVFGSVKSCDRPVVLIETVPVALNLRPLDWPKQSPLLDVVDV